MRILGLMTIMLIVSLLIGITGNALAKDEVGSIVAIRGKALIERDKESIEAKVKDSLFMNDTVLTKEASRAKLLFIDDSVLTLGENSQVVIREVIYSKHKMGRSIFGFLEGKMRAIVGKTHFEVHTPTAVAAARGTVILFETGITEDGKKYTLIIVLEGEATITSTDSSVEGSVPLTAGMMVMIIEGEPVLPTPTVAPIEEIERLLNSTDSSSEVSIPGPAEIHVGPKGVLIEPAGLSVEQPAGEMVPMMSPPIDQQPATPGTTPVDINVIFPD